VISIALAKHLLLLRALHMQQGEQARTQEALAAMEAQRVRDEQHVRYREIEGDIAR